MGLEQVLLALSIIMFVAQVFAWRWARNLQSNLKLSEGYELARILAWIIGWSLVARMIGLAAVVVIDRDDLDATLMLAIVTQLSAAAIFVWAAVQIWRLSRQSDSDRDSAPPEGGEGLEGVGVEVDQVGSDSAVAVDDPNANAALFGTH